MAFNYLYSMLTDCSISLFIFFGLIQFKNHKIWMFFFVNQYRDEVEKLAGIKIKPYNKRKRNKIIWCFL